MEHADALTLKLQALRRALDAFGQALKINDADFAGIELETMQCGKVQKFEVCVELFWKAMKKFLYGVHGIDSVSPKMVVKSLYQTQYIDETSYEMLIEMINDRNRFSHLYDEAGFQAIYQRLGEYFQAMLTVLRKVS